MTRSIILGNAEAGTVAVPSCEAEHPGSEESTITSPALVPSGSAQYRLRFGREGLGAAAVASRGEDAEGEGAGRAAMSAGAQSGAHVAGRGRSQCVRFELWST